MDTFNEFISNTNTKIKIASIAKHFEGYYQDNYNYLVPADIEILIEGWLHNFKHFKGIDYNIVLRILDNITMFRDQEIRGLFLSKINTRILPSFNRTLNDIYICPLGEEHESSFRLSAFFNNKEEVPHYSSDINTLLGIIKNKPNAIIVFFDDYLFSGGQLVCIFKKLLGIKLDPDDTDDIYLERTTIENPNLINEFKKHEIVLYYHLAFKSGYENEKFKSFLKKQDLSVTIVPGQLETEDLTCFGTSEDIRLILGKSSKQFQSGVFSNFAASEIKPIYELLQEVGELLLKNEHPESTKWNKETYKKHSLGYGGKAKLIMGEQNVPTSTLTSLWLPSKENKNKKIYIRGQEIIWKSLFYRKPKKNDSINSDILSKVTFPKISVRFIYNDINFNDPFNYDLITRIIINRLDFVYIFGHEQIELLSLATHLNDLEIIFDSKQAKLPHYDKRKWYTFEINSTNIFNQATNFNNQINNNIFSTIGLIIVIIDINLSLTSINSFLAIIIRNNSNKTFSVILDCSTRNINQLTQLKNSLSINLPIEIYVSNNISINTLNLKTHYSIFGEYKATEYISFYLRNCLQIKSENDLNNIKKILKSFEKVKSELQITVDTSIDKFMPDQFILNFENIISNKSNNLEDWLNFFKELISVCDLYTPEFIEPIIYYSAHSNSDLLRYSALIYIISNDNSYLLDYWLEGTNCNITYFENIQKFIRTPISYLFYPLLRYYNRHKFRDDLNNNILRIIKLHLNGEFFSDNWLAEYILSNNSKLQLIEILYNNSLNIIKLVESGVDIFDEIDTSLLNNKMVPPTMIEKLILTTKMTNTKIDIITKYYSYLILIK